MTIFHHRAHRGHREKKDSVLFVLSVVKSLNCQPIFS